MSYSIVIVTCPNKKIANQIAESLLKKKLIACVNILPIKSKYLWKSKIKKHSEILMILKTNTELFSKIERDIKRLHSYEMPEIISLKIDKGNKDYLDWISGETR